MRLEVKSRESFDDVLESGSGGGGGEVLRDGVAEVGVSWWR